MKDGIKNKLILFFSLVLLLFIASGCGSSNDSITDISDETPLTNGINTNDTNWGMLNVRAIEFIELMAQGDFDTATIMFNDEMSVALDATALEDVWQQHIVAQAGAFVTVHETENVEADGFYIVLIASRHEISGVTLSITFSADGLIAGFNIGGFPTLRETELKETIGFTNYPIIIGEGTDWPLDGMLSMPEDWAVPIPAVVIVQGSGPSDMDGTATLYIYRQIAEHLAENGIASIRYDKRTLTHGARLPQGFTIREEAIYDAILAAEILRADPRIDENRVYIIGHSLGGAIAPRIHIEGGNFAGLILMAGSPRDIFGEVMIEQLATAITEAVEMGALDEAEADVQLEALQEMEELFASVVYITEEEGKAITIPMVGFSANYQRDMLLHPFSNFVEDVTVPILVMQGGRDFQVLADVDFVMLQEMLAGRNNATFKLYDDLNHSFVISTATNFTEHAVDMQTNLGSIDRQVLQDIVDWIINDLDPTTR